MSGTSRPGAPPSKRVRFDRASPNTSTASPPPRDASPAAPGAAPKLDANDVVELRFVRTLAEIGPQGARKPHTVPGLAAHPTFTHQIFPDGRVHGALSASAAIYYTPASLDCWIDVHSVPFADRNGVGDGDGDGDSNVVPASEQPATDIAASLAMFVRSGLNETRDQFVAAVSADSDFVPPFAYKTEHATPQSFATQATSSSQSVHSSRSPHVLSYTARKSTFSVYKHRLSASPAITDYHKRMQLLMFLYIDGASFIDDTDPRWEVFAVFEHSKRTNAPHTLVGYATVYPFSAMRPGASLNDGFAERIRVSQVFILPFYQRAGHGGRLLSAIYADAVARAAIEVTVEDPSEGFRLLRDTTDLCRAYRARVLDEAAPLSSPFVPDADAEAALIARMRTELLITKVQARRCLEIHQLIFVDRDDDAAYKQYRLWVKRRLHAEYLEILDGFPDKDRKARLAEIYEDYEREYSKCVSRFERC
jgi:histone acetyltransferase 1